MPSWELQCSQAHAGAAWLLRSETLTARTQGRVWTAGATHPLARSSVHGWAQSKRHPAACELLIGTVLEVTHETNQWKPSLEEGKARAAQQKECALPLNLENMQDGNHAK